MKSFEYLIVTIDGCGEYITSSHKEKCGVYHIGGENCPGYHYVRNWAPIDDLGNDGWELVSINFERDSEATAFFKRMVEQ